MNDFIFRKPRSFGIHSWETLFLRQTRSQLAGVLCFHPVVIQLKTINVKKWALCRARVKLVNFLPFNHFTFTKHVTFSQNSCQKLCPQRTPKSWFCGWSHQRKVTNQQTKDMKRNQYAEDSTAQFTRPQPSNLQWLWWWDAYPLFQLIVQQGDECDM